MRDKRRGCVVGQEAGADDTPQIISASRRTDIPAFFGEWLLRRLRAGVCEYWHPFSKRWHQVSLRPEDVVGLVLWTKNLGPLLPRLDEIARDYRFYVQFTITGHGPALERNVIPPQEAVRQAVELSRRFGPQALVWRFDPIVHTQYCSPADTLARFRGLCAALAGATRRCVISFMSPYRRQARNFARLGLEYREPSPALRVELSQEMAWIAGQHGLTVSACCNPDIVQGPVARARCVDPELLRAVGAELPVRIPPSPSRPGCGCARSADIGAYDMCGGGCAYCYANQDHQLALRNLARHHAGHVSLAEAWLARGG